MQSRILFALVSNSSLAPSSLLWLIFIHVCPWEGRFHQSIFRFATAPLVINPLITVLQYGLFQAVISLCHQKILTICANSVNKIQEPIKDLGTILCCCSAHPLRCSDSLLDRACKFLEQDTRESVVTLKCSPGRAHAEWHYQGRARGNMLTLAWKYAGLKIANKCGLMAEIKMPCAKMYLWGVNFAQSVLLLTPPLLRRDLQDKPRIFRTVTASWPNSIVVLVFV